MQLSVYIPCHNQEHTIADAIESVLGQTRPADEILVVDDCSSDASPEVIAKYHKAYPDLIRPLWNDENRGISAVRNQAIEACRGTHVTYLDGDDVFYPEKLEREAEAAASGSVELVFSNTLLVDIEQGVSEPWIEDAGGFNINVLAETFGRLFPKGRLFRMELVQRDRYAQAGPFDPKLPLFEDWDMRIRLAARCRAAFCTPVASEYRLHGGGLSTAPPSRYVDATTYIIEKNRRCLHELPPLERRRALKGAHRCLARAEARDAMARIGERSPRRVFSAASLSCRALKHSPGESFSQLRIEGTRQLRRGVKKLLKRARGPVNVSKPRSGSRCMCWRR